MIIIGGPTASGKTALAALVARSLNGEIVSADSMQIYQGMDIGTAKAKDNQIGVRQHLIDIVAPDESFSVVDYRNAAVAAIRDIESRKKLPVVTGGTGFYISSLLTEYGYGSDNDCNQNLRRELENELTNKGSQFLHDRLFALDPAAAAKIHPNNIKRVLRALEVCLATGKPFSNQQNIRKNPVSPYMLFVLRVNDRQSLRQKIDVRVDKMIADGLENEVHSLIFDKGLNFSMQSMQGIGYKEWRARFEFGAEVPAVAEEIKKNTRAYAKRQQTWFAHQYEDAIYLDASESLQTLAERIAEHAHLQKHSYSVFQNENNLKTE
jgi:tRNA dimethylallyltransferase